MLHRLMHISTKERLKIKIPIQERILHENEHSHQMHTTENGSTENIVEKLINQSNRVGVPAAAK